MADEPTLGEVVRRVEAGFADVKEDLQSLSTRLDARVSMERYQLEQLARDKEFKELTDRVKALEEAAREKVQQRASDRRLIFSALIVPVLLVFLQVYLSTRGATS